MNVGHTRITVKKKTTASFNLSNLRRPTREKDHSGIAVKMTAKLQGPERTKAKERIPRPHLQIDGGSDKTISPGRSRAMLSGMEPLYLPPSTFISSPRKGTIRKQGPRLHYSAEHIACFGKNSRDTFVFSFWKVYFYSVGD